MQKRCYEFKLIPCRNQVENMGYLCMDLICSSRFQFSSFWWAHIYNSPMYVLACDILKIHGLPPLQLTSQRQLLCSIFLCFGHNLAKNLEGEKQQKTYNWSLLQACFLALELSQERTGNQCLILEDKHGTKFALELCHFHHFQRMNLHSLKNNHLQSHEINHSNPMQKECFFIRNIFHHLHLP